MNIPIFPALALCCIAASASAMVPKDVYKKSGPAVVLILGSDGGNAGAGGTGSIVAADGKVITNAHVVLNKAGEPYKKIYVFLKPPRITGDNAKDLVNRYLGTVLAFSGVDELDLALLQIEKAPPSLPVIQFADPNKVEIGDEVVAIGHPEMGGLWTLTTGTVSTVIANFSGVRGKDVFQTEASVNRGNSGGPLLDTEGAMVGVNTAIARQGMGGVAITDVNFSLKSSVVVRWLAGQGMGIAYRQEKEPDRVVVAVEPQDPGAVAEHAVVASDGALVARPRPQRAQVVKEPPPATIVVREVPPAHPERVRGAGKNLGKEKQEEKIVEGKKLDFRQAKPTYHTKKRPYSLDALRKQQMKDLENMMKEMRGVIDRKNRGRADDGMDKW